jgi:flavorubredoxin
METSVVEIADRIYRLSTFVERADIRFNQFLVVAEETLLFHCGLRRLFPLVSEAASRVIPLEEIRWISYGHHEADESGSMNDWLAVSPHARVAVGKLGCMLSAVDLASREPTALEDGEKLHLGGKRVRYLATPHVPHGWDAGLIFEETTNTLLCGDLFTQVGDRGDVTEGDIVGPAFEAEEQYGMTAITAGTAPTIRRLSDLGPGTLGLMHGPAFHGNGEQALRELADGYELRFLKGRQGR